MKKTLPLEREVVLDGNVHVYDGGGFPTDEQFSVRGFPSLRMIGSGGTDASR